MKQQACDGGNRGPGHVFETKHADWETKKNYPEKTKLRCTVERWDAKEGCQVSPTRSGRRATTPKKPRGRRTLPCHQQQALRLDQHTCPTFRTTGRISRRTARRSRTTATCTPSSLPTRPSFGSRSGMTSGRRRQVRKVPRSSRHGAEWRGAEAPAEDGSEGRGSGLIIRSWTRVNPLKACLDRDVPRKEGKVSTRDGCLGNSRNS